MLLFGAGATGDGPCSETALLAFPIDSPRLIDRQLGGSLRLGAHDPGCFVPRPAFFFFCFSGAKDMAGFIKKEFDRKYKPTWHCIVGRHFGSFVTYEKNCFIYFYSGQVGGAVTRAPAARPSPPH